MDLVILLIVAIVEAVAAATAVYFFGNKQKGQGKKLLKTLQDELKSKQQLRDRIIGLYSQMILLSELRTKYEEVRSYEESLKTERGRITITQAELETVENRLRELDEIERELQASAIETQEEIKILKKKERELDSQNKGLKDRIANSLGEIDKAMAEIEMTAAMVQQVDSMKMALLESEQKMVEVLMQIELGNEQYFILKQRYDALDIEYAQLYEKFSEVEAMVGKEDK